ncbi:rho-related GTP-binding protein RhoN [Aplysia californica]|uniref:Rho-related GTP-binding protein RhoN n=1 Tax=Aplysia californica TaxID=6500 RepID=A0ABM0JAA6_APLCA|nr:rho-related GTP-binding protein RhoN [Aplysia californica]
MKDKKCTDFVFMPLKDGGRPSPRGEGGSKDKGAAAAASGSDSNLAASGGGTEVRSKIVVVGACGCGKTSLIHRYVRDAFTESYAPTGFDTYNSHYSVSDTYRIHMSIWDTSGDVGYDRVRPLSYTEADLVIICFAIDRPESMEEVVAKWYPEVKEHCPNQPVMLVGCKSDMRSEIRAMPPGRRRPEFVTYDQGLKTAKYIGALVYSETSAKNSARSVCDVMEVAALSSAGAKSGCSFTASGSSGTTTTTSNSSTGSSANSNSSADSPNFRRQRSFIRRKRFTGMNEAKVHLRKEAAKSCVVM